MTKPTFSNKLRREARGYHSSIAVVLFVVFVTVTVFLFILALKGTFSNKSSNTEAKPDQAAEKEVEEAKTEPQNKEETTYTVKSGDTLYEIGMKVGVSWKKIAETNKLEEPYSLTVGQELKIPKDSNGN